MPFDGLRPYLDTLERKNLLKWVDREVDRDWEIGTVTRMMFRAMPEERRVGIGFRNIRGFPGGRVVTGVVAASLDMIAAALECEPHAKAINERVLRGIKAPLPTTMVKDGPCKEVKLGPGELDLTKIPTPVWTPGKDAGPYFTPLWVTRDPDTGRRNLGIRRCQVKGPNKTGILFGAPDRGGAIHHTKWKLRGQSMPAAFYVGADPVHYLVAPSRYGEDELAVAGGIRGAPVEMVKCETVDLEVPASAEFVVEGEVSMSETEPEGPFGEFTGYMAGGRAGPVFNVKCITHRKNPIVMGVVSQFPPSESSMIKKVLLEAGLVRHLTETLNIPGIADAHVLEAGGGTAVLWVSLRKTYTGQVDQVMFGALGHFGTSYFKWLVVTDDDVDIRDPFMRDWILSWRVQPDRDLRIIPNSGAVELDPSVHPPDVILKERLGAKVLIDATKKFEYPAISLPPMQFLQRVYSSWSDYGLPALDTLRLPKGL